MSSLRYLFLHKSMYKIQMHKYFLGGVSKMAVVFCGVTCNLGVPTYSFPLKAWDTANIVGFLMPSPKQFTWEPIQNTR